MHHAVSIIALLYGSLYTEYERECGITAVYFVQKNEFCK